MPPEQDIEYHPYGEQQVYTDTLGQEYRFTGKEHDPETNLDYFGARYYGSAFGRFLTPDWSATPVPVPYAKPGLPQTLNLYSYVRNNPITGIDPDGHDEVVIQFRAFIPQASVGGFKGDNRGFSADKNASSRVAVTVKIETDPAKNHGNPMVGKPETKIGSTTFEPTGSTKTSDGPKPPQVTATQDKNGNVTVNVQENMRNPFTPVGSGIQSNVNITVNQDATKADINGTVSKSPAFEANFAVNGGESKNVPLQDASRNAVMFGINLQRTAPINQQADLKTNRPTNAPDERPPGTSPDNK
jgi:RHS repeat-associated protein